MKKLIIGLVAIVIVAIVVLGGLFFRNYTALHISPAMCEFLLDGSRPKEFCETNGKGTWLEHKYLLAKTNEDGCLIIVLRKSTINEWKNTFTDLQILQCVLGDSRDIGITIDYSKDFQAYMENAHTCGFEISEDFKKVFSSPEDSRWYYSFVLPACVKMQIFEGKPCSEVEVECIETDASGKIINRFVFPSDSTHKSGTIE